VDGDRIEFIYQPVNARTLADTIVMTSARIVSQKPEKELIFLASFVY